MYLRYSVSNRVVGTDDVNERGEERKNMPVLGRDKVRQPAIVAPWVCVYVCACVCVCVCTCSCTCIVHCTYVHV